jgi:hypothetical protein
MTFSSTKLTFYVHKHTHTHIFTPETIPLPGTQFPTQLRVQIETAYPYYVMTGTCCLVKVTIQQGHTSSNTDLRLPGLPHLPQS